MNAIDRVKTLKPKRYSWIIDDLDGVGTLTASSPMRYRCP